ncbi:gamma-glutamyl-gamma-aminobutyrate hydrolase, partial [Burkholderia cenocepacia]|nr:gamma-glutamyl-gamma-aminobutyrate hydrolase [Burkholderia cenocepacia]
MSETTPSPAGLPGTSSASSDSPRPDPAKTPDAPATQAAAHNVADDGASPVTAASEPGAPGAAGAVGDGAAAAL